MTEVINLIKILDNQVILPTKILILDSSAIEFNFENTINNEQFSRIIYEHQKISLIEARKYSYEYAKANSYDILHFIDDDTIPFVRYFEIIENEFLEDFNLSACGGTVIDNIPGSMLKKFYNYIYKDGKVTLFGNGIATYSQLQSTNVDWLPGCSMSYNVKKLQISDFDLDLVPYKSMGEDLHISFAVAKRGVVRRVKGAFIYHYQSLINRPDERKWIAYTLAQRKIFLVKHGQSFVTLKLIMYSLFRIIIFNVFLFYDIKKTRIESQEHLRFLYTEIKQKILDNFQVTNKKS
jgi:GT2 family glycosyltransferase